MGLFDRFLHRQPLTLPEFRLAELRFELERPVASEPAAGEPRPLATPGELLDAIERHLAASDRNASLAPAGDDLSNALTGLGSSLGGFTPPP
jgi:hypothetical protein